MGRQTIPEIVERMRKFCAYQDRCHSEVRSKLLKLEVYGDDLEEVMSQLISEKFLDEERYARSYVRGKFRMNRWGRFKIRMNLKQKQVSDYCIRKGFEEISDEDYETTVDELLRAKLKDDFSFESRQKAKAALMRKGFEPELISSRIGVLQSYK